VPAVASVTRYQVNQGAVDRLTRSLQGPIGSDIQRRALRVTARMKANASGRPGPNIRTGTLVSAIAFLRFAVDTKSLYADIGPRGFRVVKRGYNYSTLLEFGNPGGQRFGPRSAYPFIVKSLDAAR